MTETGKRERALRALVASAWNVSAAARALSVHRQALQRDVRRWGGLSVLRLAHAGGDSMVDPERASQPRATHHKSTTVPLDRDEWLFLRRRAELEADQGGDSSLRGAIKALIREAMRSSVADEGRGGGSS